MSVERWLLVMNALWLCPTVIGSSIVGCELATRKNLRSGKLAQIPELFVEGSFLMERTSTQVDALVRFRTSRAVNCELTFWKQELGDAVPSNGASLAACSNSNPSTEFAESIGGLDRKGLYIIQVAAWESGQDRQNAQKLLIREPQASIDDQDLILARFNVPLRTLDVYRSQRGKKTPEERLNDLKSRDKKCEKAIAMKVNEPYLPVEKFVKIDTLSAKGLVVGAGVPNANDAARLQVISGQPYKVAEYEFQYRTGGQNSAVSGSGITTLSSAKAISEASIVFPEPQLTIAERKTVELNKARPFRFEWNLQQADNAGYVLVQLGYPGQNHSITCVFDAKVGFGEVPTSLIKDIPSGKHDMTIDAVSFRLNGSDSKNVVPWLVSVHDWRIARFQVL